MANSITLSIPGLDELQSRLKNMAQNIANRIDETLIINAEEIAANAKTKAPVDEGLLRESISAVNKGFLEKSISVNVFYAAYMEFGTGQYAAQYVSTLPANWQQYAATFRGKGGGSFSEMILALQEWVRRKGIGTKKDYKQIGYALAIKILKKGVHPHPFLVPAFEEQQPILIEDIKAVLDEL